MLRSLPFLGLVILAACSSPPGPPAVRLVDVFHTATIDGGGDGAAPERTEWRFDSGDAGWKSLNGVTAVEVRDGQLRGRATDPLPLLVAERPAGLDEAGMLHGVEVRLWVSRGANVSLYATSRKTPNVGALRRDARSGNWDMTSPLLPSDEPQTYTMTTSRSIPASSIRHLVLRPTDEAGAEFAVESIRLIFRREYLASIPSGVSWQGLSEIYRETIVTRTPETARFELTLPENPWLDLTVGTIEDEPVRFRVVVNDTIVKEHEVARAGEWEVTPVDLNDYGGESVTLSLSLDSDTPGTLGLWGAPAVRSRGAVPAHAYAVDPPQGVLYILCDSLRRDHLEIYGHERSTAPTVAQMAASGTLFLDDQAQADWTKASVPSNLTSRYQSANGIVNIPDRVPSAAVTIAEVYRAAGYATWASAGNDFAGKLSNLHQGVEVLHEPGSVVLPRGLGTSKNARTYVDRLLPWLELHRDTPFFVFLHFLDPHPPFQTYAPYDSQWADPSWQDEHYAEMERVRGFIDARGGIRKRLALATADELDRAGIDKERFVEREKDWYDGSIRAMDAELAKVFAKLDELGLSERVVVSFISDHGEEFLDHGLHFNGNNLYGENTNVPLVLWGPGRIPEGKTVAETVQSIDLAPTLIELSGLEVPETMMGRSLVPLLSDGHVRRVRWPSISERIHNSWINDNTANGTAIVWKGWKLIHNTDRPPGHPEYELFHHDEDPWSLRDVAAEHPEKVEELAEILERWRRWVDSKQLPTDAELSQEVSAEELERLRSLGYVQ
jgi:arylsulfatase